jgi:hypothetical protein
LLRVFGMMSSHDRIGGRCRTNGAPLVRLLLPCDHGLRCAIGRTLQRKHEVGALDRAGPSITAQALKTFASEARRQMRTEAGGYRRDHLRALAQRVEVDAKEVRIMGSKGALLRTLVAASGAKTAGFGVPSFIPKWRTRHDSNV